MCGHTTGRDRGSWRFSVTAWLAFWTAAVYPARWAGGSSEVRPWEQPPRWVPHGEPRCANRLMEYWGGRAEGGQSFPYFEGEAKVCTENTRGGRALLSRPGRRRRLPSHRTGLPNRARPGGCRWRR